MNLSLPILAALSDGTSSTTVFPLLILLLVAGWVCFLVVASVWLLAASPHPDHRRLELLLSAVVFAAGCGAAILLSPIPPVLCTFTGASHITSAYHIAAMTWQWNFPSDYPLTVPTLAAGFVALAGKFPGCFRAANIFLHAFGAVAIFHLVSNLTSSRTSGIVIGLVAALLPLNLVFAGGDGLSVGYYTLSAWTILFASSTADANGWPRKLASIGMSAALFLTIQSRPEAFLFAVIPLLFVWSRVGNRRPILLRVARLSGIALLFSIPYLVHTFSKFGPDRLQTELGTFTARNFLLATAFTAGGLIVMGRVAARSLSRPTRATVGAIGLGGLYLLAALLFWGGGFLRTETHCFDPHCAGQTFRNVLTWHGNPKVVPVGLILLAFAGLGSFRCRRQARLLAVLVTWFGMSIAAASVKMTGELPFEGLRTQLPASVPFLLVAGIGAHHLFPARSGTGLRVAVLAVLIGCTAVVPFRVLQSFGFDEQDEYRFLEECMAKIPANATLYVPDDTLDALLPGDTEPTQVDLAGLFRSHFVVESLGEKSRGIRTRRISSLLEYGPQGPSYFFRGLNCYRTGSRTMTPACSAALWSLRLDAVCEQTVANRPYTADFYPALKILPDRIPLGIYRIVPPGEESNAEAGDCQSQ